MVRGALAAALTPLRDGGDVLDEESFAPYVEFLADRGLDGVFALGTTGEGILLDENERRRALELFAEAAGGRLALVAHCGAQSTRETVALCAHAAEIGVDGVAVIGPPYFAFDERALEAHFLAAARACAPTPFYVYELAARSGYAIPVSVVERVRDAADNVIGMKVSDAPFSAVEPYLLPGLDVFVGAEPLVPAGLARGAVGAVSGLASVFPEAVVALLRDPGEETVALVRALRDALERAPFIPAAKRALTRRGVAVREDVRAPLRRLDQEERAEVDRVVAAWLESTPAMPPPPPPGPSRAGRAPLAAGEPSRSPQRPSTAAVPNRRAR
jgi:dihydrodipicolinate synthase/N-acetylneuraminate lyase